MRLPRLKSTLQNVTWHVTLLGIQLYLDELDTLIGWIVRGLWRGAIHDPERCLAYLPLWCETFLVVLAVLAYINSGLWERPPGLMLLYEIFK